MTKPVIELYGFDGLGLIVTFPSGVLYSNQVAGHGCLHPEIEGVLVPLPIKVGRPEIYALQQHFRGYWRHIEANDADIVDRILRRNDLDYLRVDRTKMDDSYEAWIHVKIDPKKATVRHSSLGDFGEAAGVLTWLNSD